MESTVPAVPVSALAEDIGLLDVREDDEWAAGHAPTAVHVPMGQVSQRLDEIAAAVPGRPVHVVCRSGTRSARVAAYLSEIGLDAVNVTGGMQAWSGAGRPLVAEAGAPPTVL